MAATAWSWPCATSASPRAKLPRGRPRHSTRRRRRGAPARADARGTIERRNLHPPPPPPNMDPGRWRRRPNWPTPERMEPYCCRLRPAASPRCSATDWSRDEPLPPGLARGVVLGGERLELVHRARVGHHRERRADCRSRRRCSCTRSAGGRSAGCPPCALRRVEVALDPLVLTRVVVGLRPVDSPCRIAERESSAACSLPSHAVPMPESCRPCVPRQSGRVKNGMPAGPYGYRLLADVEPQPLCPADRRLVAGVDEVLEHRVRSSRRLHHRARGPREGARLLDELLPGDEPHLPEAVGRRARSSTGPHPNIAPTSPSRLAANETSEPQAVDQRDGAGRA
jgi:hypothetical protein